jgi:hypothetical protein
MLTLVGAGYSTFRIPHSAFLLVCCLELFLATRGLAYHARLTAPDALTDLRPSLTQLKIGATDTPPGRLLSISDTLFDPGDAAELKSIFADQLPPDAYYDLLVASKQKEIAAPNLPLYYRLPAVDGYDGGVLPLRTYLAFQRLFLSPDAIQSDGRLREQLKSIPDARWLDLMNVKYVITDKVRDRWFDGVFYDLQFATRLTSGEEVFIDRLPSSDANALGLVYSEPMADHTLGEVDVLLEDGASLTLPIVEAPVEPADGLSVTRLRWVEPKRVASLRVRGVGGFTLNGAALIDERSGTFQSFALAKGGRFRLAHSGDVKVYENLDAPRVPRAFVVSEVRFAAGDDEAIAMMTKTGFDPSQTVVLASNTPRLTQRAEHRAQYALRFAHYDPEHIALEVDTDSAGYLVFADAWYPGWIATVDGKPVDIERADVYFRAVPIEVGRHRVEFRYEPRTFAVGAAVSGVTWGAVVAVLIVVYARRHS